MDESHSARVRCEICGKARKLDEVMPLELVRPSVADIIRKEHPGLPPSGFICDDDLDHYRAEYIEDALEAEVGELSKLEQDVLESIKEHELITEDVNEAYETRLTLGERLADRIAEFGGSWRFIISFGLVLAVWIGFNTLSPAADHYDPYPYILLNLVLSCLAALQAPIIMMSQNRQEAKDRLRSEYDYRINLKAELEIRHLNEKMDHLIMRQWQRLLEIQRIQTQIMEEVARRARTGGQGTGATR